MNIVMENIITGIVKPAGGPIGKEQSLKEPVTQRNNSSAEIRKKDGEIPIGLGVVPIIPTGSIFIPRELVLPEEEKPLEVEVIISDKQSLIPQNVEEKTKEAQGVSPKPEPEQAKETPPQQTTNTNTHSIDIFI